MEHRPNISLTDIAGCKFAKKVLTEAILLPNSMPELFDGKRKSWKRMQIYGPPGVGKTSQCKAQCKESNLTPFWVSISDLTSRFIGESEKLLIGQFELAREHSPSLIVIDEMDSIGRQRVNNESEAERRFKTEFYRQIDLISSCLEDVYVQATTNMPWEIDMSVLRRFERKCLLPQPNQEARLEIFKSNAKEENTLTPENFQELADFTCGYSGADLLNIITEAYQKPQHELQQVQKLTKQYSGKKSPKNLEILGEKNSPNVDGLNENRCEVRKVNLRDFKESIRNTNPTVGPKTMDLYYQYMLKFGHSEQKSEVDMEYQKTWKLGYII